MEVIAFFLAFVAFATAASGKSKIKILEKQIALIREHVNFSDIDMLSSETKEMIGNAANDEVIKAIRAELDISQKDAEALIDSIETQKK